MAYKKKKRLLTRRKRTLDPTTVVDYKSPDILKRFITDRGKIIPRRISGATAKQQRAICKAVKRARYLAILPYSTAHRNEKGFTGMVTLSYAGFDRDRMRAKIFDNRRPGGYNRDNRDGGRDNRDRPSSSAPSSGGSASSSAPASSAPASEAPAPKPAAPKTEENS